VSPGGYDGRLRAYTSARYEKRRVGSVSME
jgi:hypothetical protein